VFLARFLNREISLAKDSQNVHEYERRLNIEGITRLLASELAHDNPKFNSEKFLRAAGIE
jgi:hypothetical protein